MTPRSVRAFALSAFMIACGAPTSSASEAEGDPLPHHAVALEIGAGSEEKHGKEKEVGIAVGAKYDLRFHRRWSVAAVVEALGQDTLRDLVLVVPVAFHPWRGLRLVAGPGIEFGHEDVPLLRAGVGYDLHLSGPWALEPELFADLLEGEDYTLLGMLAVVRRI